MARYIGPVCRLCRREDMKLFLKGERCYTDKCGYERRSYPPGQHGQARRRKRSDYGEQLREKQKVKRIYGIAERQFRGYYYKASRMKGVTGDNLIQLLERRLDNVVYRMGFASDHAEARQLVRHGHFKVNGRRVNIPSYLVRTNDAVEVVDKSRTVNRIIEALGAVERRGVPRWIELDKDAFKGVVKTMPARDDVTLPIREQLIVELYSK
ncbi:MAG TPA: 30S ribosomal protein S4 [Kofleriaceae bacterium]|jgi:small subunit ribosomal protein S4|nr:30S ribosomal protein S4 [Kofleriaceae bacterium]